MVIYLGADHRGFALKERLKAALKEEGYEIADEVAAALAPDDDYPDYAGAVARGVASAPDLSRGIVVCGSGIGADIAANKVSGVRAGLAASPDQAYQGRHDDDINVLALAADFTDEAAALKIAKVFLTTPFDGGERYARRLRKIAGLEA